jgi:signal transduction histidine kinase
MRLARMRERAARECCGGGIVTEIDELTANIDAIITSTRTLTSDLSPTILYELGLAPALRWIAAKVLTAVGVEVEWDVACDDTATRAVRALAFQCVRETFVNVAKHANARRVKVSLAQGDGVLRITVADDGVGFDVQKLHAEPRAAGGFGLFNVREQLNYLGGRLEIRSAPGGPTEVCVTMPIAQG